MTSNDIEKTLPLSEQVVRDAWRDFTASSPSLVSVPAFLSWLGHHQPQVLELVSENALIAIAEKLGLPGN